MQAISFRLICNHERQISIGIHKVWRGSRSVRTSKAGLIKKNIYKSILLVCSYTWNQSTSETSLTCRRTWHGDGGYRSHSSLQVYQFNLSSYSKRFSDALPSLDFTFVSELVIVSNLPSCPTGQLISFNWRLLELDSLFFWPIFSRNFQSPEQL